jgi:hypothetical protein
MTHGVTAFAVSTVLIVAAVPPAAVRAQNWPQFRGPKAGVAPDDPRLPDTWSATENVVWSVDIAGRSWSSPVVWGDHVFVISAINARQPAQPLNPVSTYLARSLGGPMSGAAISESTDEHRWMLYDIDVETGKVRWERAILAAVPRQPRASEEFVRVGNAGDRRPTGLRLSWLRRSLRIRHERWARLVEADGRIEDAHGLGHRGFAGAP